MSRFLVKSIIYKILPKKKKKKFQQKLLHSILDEQIEKYKNTDNFAFSIKRYLRNFIFSRSCWIKQIQLAKNIQLSFTKYSVNSLDSSDNFPTLHITYIKTFLVQLSCIRIFVHVLYNPCFWLAYSAYILIIKMNTTGSL